MLHIYIGRENNVTNHHLHLTQLQQLSVFCQSYFSYSSTSTFFWNNKHYFTHYYHSSPELFSSCIPETLDAVNNNSSFIAPLLPAPSNYTFCLYDFDYFKYLKWNHSVLDFFVIGLLHLP